jgi:pimeloyl-ACP methyl ester carboxylesterase
MYRIQKASRSEFLPIRKLNYHLRVWGESQANTPPLVLVHGWMDVSASFQFMVDALQKDRWIIAPDWRGFGLTQAPQADNYWFPDYLADLDAILDHYAPDQAVHLVGHSMGGHIATLYAGVRPARVARLINLEGFGMPASRPDQAPKRYAKWMDELKGLARGEFALKGYDSAQAVAQRLMKNNRRLSEDKALWLAQHWAAPDAQGRWQILGDAAHKIINAQLFRLDEVSSVYDNITAPCLFATASDDSLATWWGDKYTLPQFIERIKVIKNHEIKEIPDCGHMLHHDQPGYLSNVLETFLN